jgi:hypothetical protein
MADHVPEGLSTAEVGKEIGEHGRHAAAHQGAGRHGRVISITEAVLLSIVAIIAAWSGYSAAKMGHRFVAQAGQGVCNSDEGKSSLPAIADVSRR